MKKRTEGIIRMGQVNITERGERDGVGSNRLQPFYGNLNVDNRLRLKARNRRRAVVLDALSEFP